MELSNTQIQKYSDDLVEMILAHETTRYDFIDGYEFFELEKGTLETLSELFYVFNELPIYFNELAGENSSNCAQGNSQISFDLSNVLEIDDQIIQENVLPIETISKIIDQSILKEASVILPTEIAKHEYAIDIHDVPSTNCAFGSPPSQKPIYENSPVNIADRHIQSMNIALMITYSILASFPSPLWILFVIANHITLTSEFTKKFNPFPYTIFKQLYTKTNLRDNPLMNSPIYLAMNSLANSRINAPHFFDTSTSHCKFQKILAIDCQTPRVARPETLV